MFKIYRFATLVLAASFALQTFAAGAEKGSAALQRKIEDLPLTEGSQKAIAKATKGKTVADLAQTRRGNYDESQTTLSEIDRILSKSRLRIGVTSAEVDFYRREGRLPKINSDSLVEALKLSSAAQSVLNNLKINTIGELAAKIQTGLRKNSGITANLEAEYLNAMEAAKMLPPAAPVARTPAKPAPQPIVEKAKPAAPVVQTPIQKAPKYIDPGQAPQPYIDDTPPPRVVAPKPVAQPTPQSRVVLVPLPAADIRPEESQAELMKILNEVTKASGVKPEDVPMLNGLINHTIGKLEFKMKYQPDISDAELGAAFAKILDPDGEMSTAKLNYLARMAMVLVEPRRFKLYETFILGTIKKIKGADPRYSINFPEFANWIQRIRIFSGKDLGLLYAEAFRELTGQDINCMTSLETVFRKQGR